MWRVAYFFCCFCLFVFYLFIRRLDFVQLLTVVVLLHEIVVLSHSPSKNQQFSRLFLFIYALINKSFLVYSLLLLFIPYLKNLPRPFRELFHLFLCARTHTHLNCPWERDRGYLGGVLLLAPTPAKTGKFPPHRSGSDGGAERPVCYTEREREIEKKTREKNKNKTIKEGV